MNIYSYLKPLIFRFDPENIHDVVMKSAHLLPFMSNLWDTSWNSDPRLSLKVGKNHWSFPVGLAAGLDKNAVAIDFLSSLGFGSIEVGTVTPLPQEGNPKPRIFRYPELETLRNAMGFPNQGMDVIAERIQKYQKDPLCLGVNLGKNKSSEGDKAIEDYRLLYQKFAPISKYLAINISSPNTPGLRQWLQAGPLNDLLGGLASVRKEYYSPLYLKISPDLEVADLKTIVEVCQTHELDGIIATNTTMRPSWGPGGVSGQVLYDQASMIRSQLLSMLKGSDLELIGVGGFSNSAQLFEYWRSGGRAIQIYTSFIFQGPTLLSQMANDTLKLLRQTGAKNIEELLSKPNEIPL